MVNAIMGHTAFVKVFGQNEVGGHMLLEKRFDPCSVEPILAEGCSEFQGIANAVAKQDFAPALPSLSRCVIHIVAEEPRQRAVLARMIFDLGHHAEVYSDAAELVHHQPETGIVLVHEAGKHGAAAVCQILTKHGQWLPVIGFGLDIAVDRIIAGMKAGAMDYLVGQPSPRELLTKLQECAIDAQAIFEVRSRRAQSRTALAKLSDREHQVLDLVVAGLSNKEMARELSISPRTVEIHRMKMMGKLGASSSAQAVRMRLEALGN